MLCDLRVSDSDCLFSDLDASLDSWAEALQNALQVLLTSGGDGLALRTGLLKGFGQLIATLCAYVQCLITPEILENLPSASLASEGCKESTCPDFCQWPYFLQCTYTHVLAWLNPGHSMILWKLNSISPLFCGLALSGHWVLMCMSLRARRMWRAWNQSFVVPSALSSAF